MKRIIFVILSLIVIAFLGYYIKTKVLDKSPVPVTNTKIKAVASFYPLAHFTEQVGKDHVSVINVTPSGAEPHDYEPSPTQIAEIYNSRLFVANGAELDPWADRIKDDLEKHGVVVVRMSDHFQLLPGADGETQTDPHFWLDPVLAQEEVQIIRDALIKVDPANAQYYDKNAEGYISQLQALDKKYQDGLASCALKDVVTSHAAFGYLAKRYNLNQIAISGLSPDQEPSSSQMVEIAREAKQKNVKVIFFETLVSPKLAETIAREIGAQTAVFNPLEGLTDQEIKEGKNYISVMEDNLNNLRTALQCK